MVDFKNNIHAFEDKSNTDLFRAWILFKTISNPIISKILTKLLQIALLFRLPITFLIKISIFKHFCGGENIEECKKTIDKLCNSRIGSILDYSAEGKESENDFKQVYEQGMKILETSKNNEKIPFIVFKFTGLIQFKILNKISNKLELNSYEQKTYDLFINRINLICERALKIKTPIFIDAEESWIQDAIDKIVLSLMKKYNQKEVLVYNTLQMYSETLGLVGESRAIYGHTNLVLIRSHAFNTVIKKELFI